MGNRLLTGGIKLHKDVDVACGPGRVSRERPEEPDPGHPETLEILEMRAEGSQDRLFVER